MIAPKQEAAISAARYFGERSAVGLCALQIVAEICARSQAQSFLQALRSRLLSLGARFGFL